MMAANHTEHAQTSPHEGLIFEWRKPRARRFGKLGMLAFAVGIFIFPLSMIRINLGKPPIQETHAASLMLLTPENDPMYWLGMARDLGPFPTRFDPADWEASRLRVADVLDGVRNRSIPPHQPRYLDFPSEASPPSIPLVVKGSRILPVVEPPEFKPMQAVRVRPAPSLYPLSVDAAELPETRPPFRVEVTPEMAAQAWRFLLQISPDGAVLHAVALIGQNAPGRTDLIDWLQAHRFPAKEQPHDRWVAVAVTFQNQPANGAVDP